MILVQYQPGQYLSSRVINCQVSQGVWQLVCGIIRWLQSAISSLELCWKLTA